MKKSLQDALSVRFPIYVRDPDRECLYTAFGFECESGWVPLLIEFAKAAEMLDVQNVQIDQVKEKWHTLRIYFTSVGPDDDVLEDIAEDIETRSALVCEVCSKAKAAGADCDHDQVDLNLIEEQMLRVISGKPSH